MLFALQRSLVNPFEPSSCAAALLGPNALMPAAVRSSTMPAQSGASGPTTTKSMFCAWQNAITARMVGGIERHQVAFARDAGIARRADRAVATSGLAAIFQASACSRPPEPRRRMFMDALPDRRQDWRPVV